MSTTTTRPWARNLLLFILGTWFSLGAFTGYLAGKNFGILKPDAMPRASEFYGEIPEAGGQRERALRYAASELNRHYFTLSYGIQLVLAAVAMGSFALSSSRSRMVMVSLGVALLISAFLSFWLTPEIIELGRKIDDVPREPITPDRESFSGLHHIAVVVDSAKLLLILIVGVAMIRCTGARPESAS
ncbi:MAG: hypothetical protein CMJ83_20630 [Planctomycetes bacterium]|nr:hypothetical protein [Planctomycetota bacterium]